MAAGASGCQQGGDGAKARAAELSLLPGLKVMISGAGALGPDEVRAISKHLEEKGDVAAAMVRLKKKDGGPEVVEIELWGATLPAAGSIAGDLQARFPGLAGATIEAAPLEPGSGPQMAVMVEATAEDASPEEAKQEILDQLEAGGVDGKIDVKVEDGEEGRRIEVKVEKTESVDG